MDRVQIDELQDAFVLCRTLGHSWDDNPNPEVNSDLFRSARGAIFLRCTRCTTERYDYLDYQFNVYQRYYKYPQRYNTIPGQGTRPNLRGEMFRRSLLIRKSRQRRNGKG